MNQTQSHLTRAVIEFIIHAQRAFNVAFRLLFLAIQRLTGYILFSLLGMGWQDYTEYRMWEFTSIPNPVYCTPHICCILISCSLQDTEYIRGKKCTVFYNRSGTISVTRMDLLQLTNQRPVGWKTSGDDVEES